MLGSLFAVTAFAQTIAAPTTASQGGGRGMTGGLTGFQGNGGRSGEGMMRGGNWQMPVWDEMGGMMNSWQNMLSYCRTMTE